MEASDSASSTGRAGPQRRIALEDLRKKDLNLLVVLAALLEGNSVSAAAKRLGSTQPSTSRMLERLREDLGDPLLIKSALKMVPTRRAKELRAALDAVLRMIENDIYGDSESYDPSQESGTYVIGINDSLQAVIAPRFFDQLRREAPHANVRMQPVPQPSGALALANGTLDLMVAFYPIESDMLRSQQLFSARFGCLVAAANAEAGETLSAAQLAERPCLDISQFGLVTRLLDRYFIAHGYHRKTVGTLTSYLAAADAVAGTDMYAMVPSYLEPLMCRHSGVRFIAIKDPLLGLPVHLCWHNNVHTHPFVSRLRSLLVEVSEPFLQA